MASQPNEFMEPTTISDRIIDGIDISQQEWASDAFVDLLKSYGHNHISFNPGASIRGLEESIVNYNDNTCPEVVQVQNEALAVAIAHGYAKAAGTPGICALHNTVGTLQGSMAIYNAYVDQVPIVMIAGNGPLNRRKRRPWVDWMHTTQNQGSLVREITKWDDQPANVLDVFDSIIRGHRIASTKPHGPVYITVDHEIQESSLESPVEIPDLRKLIAPSKIAPDPHFIQEAAKMLLDAELPVTIVDYVGDSKKAVNALVTLSENLGMPVVDTYGHLPHRFNFPNNHPMNLTGTQIIEKADLILALDVRSILFKTSSVDLKNYETLKHIDNDVNIIDISTHDLEASSLTYDYNELMPVELGILADTDIAIPQLNEAILPRLDENAMLRQQAEDRFGRLKTLHESIRSEWQQEAQKSSTMEPIAVSWIAHELWGIVKDDPWVIVSGTLSGWPHRIWDIDDFDQYTGGMSGGGGVGYRLGAAIGGALAYEGTNRTPINFQPDGDLMQVLSGLWTLAHYDIPLFTLVHNNGCLYNSTNHRMELAKYRGRDDSFERALVGTSIRDPRPNYAGIAEDMGISGFGPVRKPENLRPTLSEAWEEAKSGKPVLVDVVCSNR